MRTPLTRMAMGKRRRRPKQTSMWVAAQDLPRSAAHPFYTRLNHILERADFDGYVESLCQRFYADEIGRPSLPPGRYFRVLLLGYFEGLDSERAIAWRAAESLSVRSFLGLELHEAPPDHSTVSRTRRLIDLETHQAVFAWVLQRLAEAKLVKGKTIGIDATTLEANAALRSIVRRDTGEAYQDFLIQLAQASGIETPTRADLARIDRKRKKKGSNDDWTHPHDPDARITKMKDGRTHLAHKAEQAVDLDTGAVVAVTVQDADEGDVATSRATLTPSTETVGVFAARAGNACCAGGQRLLRRRGERLERPFAHLYATGRLRRVYLRGHDNILKRVLLHVAGLNLGLLMRTLTGVGTPRSLQGHAVACLRLLWSLMRLPETRWGAPWILSRPTIAAADLRVGHCHVWADPSFGGAFTTGC